MFKNEAINIEEWIKHYLHHGVDHFYMINDASTDDFLSILQPYIDNNIVTLYNTSFPYYLGRQKNLYNTYILPNIKQTKWLVMVDMDEYLWSPKDINLKNVINLFNHLGQIQFYDVLFGSNGHITQPKSIVNSFTKRQAVPRKCLKYMVNSNYEFSSLNVHHATFKDLSFENIRYFQMISLDYFVNNHYNCMSKEWWVTVKMTRGDSDHYHQRTLDDFDRLDVNEVEDLRLVEQNLII